MNASSMLAFSTTATPSRLHRKAIPGSEELRLRKRTLQLLSGNLRWPVSAPQAATTLASRRHPQQREYRTTACIHPGCGGALLQRWPACSLRQTRAMEAFTAAPTA